MNSSAGDWETLLKRACVEERSISVPVPATNVAHRLVDRLGGRFSTQFGIALDRGEQEVERWFFASSLFGNRISTGVVRRTFRIFQEAGVGTVGQLGATDWGEIVSLLDRGGYAHYDLLTASRLHALAEVVERRYGGRVAAISEQYRRPYTLEKALDALPGWGPVTVHLFLRELRGVWPGADPAIDERTRGAALHLRLAFDMAPRDMLAHLHCVAARAEIDIRDLEAGLIRLAQAHGRRYRTCPGGEQCFEL